MLLFRFTGPLRIPLSIGVLFLSVLVTWNSAIYFVDGPMPAFLIEKGSLAFSSWWKTSLYFHIAAASTCLLVGGPLMFPSMLKFRRTHRFLGYVYINAVLWVAVPTGLALAVVAKGGLLSCIGFGITGIAWWYATWRGYQSIRKRKIQIHIDWMIRSYAIALSAVFFRLIQIGLFQLATDPTVNYIASIWLSLSASLLLSESAIHFSSSRVKPALDSKHEIFKQGKPT